MACGINIIGLLVIIIILIVLYIAIKNQSLDTFIVFLDDVVIPKTCWDYLVSNGKEYFLFNSKMIVDGVKNPMRFPNKQRALEHLKLSKCPVNIPFVDLVMRKKIEDPTFEGECTCIDGDCTCSSTLSPPTSNVNLLDDNDLLNINP